MAAYSLAYELKHALQLAQNLAVCHYVHHFQNMFFLPPTVCTICDARISPADLASELIMLIAF